MELKNIIRERILRLPEVKSRTGLSRSTIYLNISKGIFPKHLSLGGRAVGWLESEIDAWIKSRISQSTKSQSFASRELTEP